jgi:hypothetical protein
MTAQPRWRDFLTCSHSNENVCKFCDFDRYYARSYPSCPWREETQ